ncbi:undecaprenyldiphospho-muramoylpentapeptide beta-N-acetylglucosaminyltransferase [Ascidiimonas aurantiaca]|uniref:undecaprenyldiphospho-muramoylpentapeptide beta-N-acetylglucosaminyltransferase n=1 Tax=Ascidiimonas aurantiaca TaxID=1685432 RepID=UPI0030EDED0C
MSNYKFIISGGGTGGHIYPALAIANALKVRYPGAQFLFVGAIGRMEMEKVPQAGYEIKGLHIAGLQRKLTLQNLWFPFRLLHSLWHAFKIIKKVKPHIVIGTGGYASGPLLKMASFAGIPYLLQEQNSYPGITNKLLAGKASRICVAYDGLERYFPAHKIVKTGNPVREDLLEIASKKEEALKHFDLDPTRKTLFIVGGSQGARKINEVVEKHLSFFKDHQLQIIWQCGKRYYDEYKKHASQDVKVLHFISRMDFAYAAADFIVSRSGAGTVSELCIVGKPVVFVPSPNVAEDHQTKNAMALVAAGAALLIKEKEVFSVFEKEFSTLLHSEEMQQKFSENIKDLALPDATMHIVEEIEKILNKANTTR